MGDDTKPIAFIPEQQRLEEPFEEIAAGSTAIRR